MASGDQLKALLASHLEGDDDRFFSVAMQVAAHEAKRGHGKLAEDLRALIDQAKARRGLVPREAGGPTPISRPRGELAGLLAVSYPKDRLSHMVLDETLAAQLERIIREQRKAVQILSHGLSPRRKLLLMGPPGTGKTLTASVLAGELGLPLFQVRLDGLITKYMGETAAKLHLVFDAMTDARGIYLFDEFDAIGADRGTRNDVGEIRRVLNSFLQFLEQDDSDSLILAATNYVAMLDEALFRRFDDVVRYSRPDAEQAEQLIRNRLHAFLGRRPAWKQIHEAAAGLSHAEIARACDDAAKDCVLTDQPTIDAKLLVAAMNERRHAVASAQAGVE